MEGVEQLYRLYREDPTLSIDSRNVAVGAIFFALRGETFDGNVYAYEALRSGASHSVIDSVEIAEQCPEEYRGRITLVDDVLSTLQGLALCHRRELGIRVVAITGSNGKTTTKELLRDVLSTKYRVHATRGNLNNHIGVPLTLLSIPAGCEVAVVEMGASGVGEIAQLCSIAEPNCGVITNIGRAHLEGFGGEAGVRRGKGELFDYLERSGGVAYLPIDNEVIREEAMARPQLRCVEYNYSLSDGVESNLEGLYNRYNIATAMAIGLDMGVARECVERAIGEYLPNNNRSQRVESEHNTIIVDCYNANPSSMESSVGNFLREEYPHRESKVLILGDMFELGEWSEQEHKRVVEQAISGDVEQIMLVGREFSRVECGDARVRYFATREELIQYLLDHRIEGRAVLVKGSRGVGLEGVLGVI